MNSSGIYFAGFKHPNAIEDNSKKQKYEIFQSLFEETIKVDYNDEPIGKLEKLIEKYISENKKIYLLGFSIGSIKSLYLHFKYDIPILLINPSFFPEITLQAYLSQNEIDNIIDLKNNIKNLKHKNKPYSNFSVLLSKDDEVITYDKFLNIFNTYIKYVEWFENSGHSFIQFENRAEQIRLLMIWDELTDMDVEEVF
ncbi:MAG: hypothetical protein CVV22_12620 [Ignavibacteriae bacterium HGW-Ignavibacteriae-1]|jgi:predicted esterase YcpF (UPF0227 family)|nr:MAG: hypothetical protein CVV22_12620 [Ignavibacteriae bacterium HGW-Ignavibacteriae-1]